MFEKIQKEWLSNIQKDLLSGFVVGLSVIPETYRLCDHGGFRCGRGVLYDLLYGFCVVSFWG